MPSLIVGSGFEMGWTPEVPGVLEECWEGNESMTARTARIRERTRRRVVEEIER